TYEYSDEIPANEYVRTVFNDKNIKPETYTRKDYGLIYISNGPEILPKDVKVEDWVTGNKDVMLVQSWASTNNIELTINKVNSATVVEGGVIFQSIAPNTMISKKSKMTVNVSAGQQVIVPDFTKINREEAGAMNPLGYTLRFVEMYQPKGGATFGSLIWQDIPAGTRVDKDSTKQLVVTVYYSLGQPFISSMVGSLENVIPQTIYDFNQDSANFTYEIQYVSDAAVKGQIIDMSPFNQFVDPGQHIIFKVSTGS
ncbi:MAG: PASTA domain-containing protein, partial [Bacilli bacterium]|nr:PASTA domain-containing protein [Bacilli bacterium]